LWGSLSDAEGWVLSELSGIYKERECVVCAEFYSIVVGKLKQKKNNLCFCVLRM